MTFSQLNWTHIGSEWNYVNIQCQTKGIKSLDITSKCLTVHLLLVWDGKSSERMNGWAGGRMNGWFQVAFMTFITCYMRIKKPRTLLTWFLGELNRFEYPLVNLLFHQKLHSLLNDKPNNLPNLLTGYYYWLLPFSIFVRIVFFDAIFSMSRYFLIFRIADSNRHSNGKSLAYISEMGERAREKERERVY